MKTKREKKNQDQCETTIFCRKCGKKLLNDSVFCDKCGCKVVDFNVDRPDQTSDLNDLKYETNEKVNKHNKGKIILFSILGVILVALVAAISIHLSNVYSNGRNEDETFNNNYSSNVNNPNKQELRLGA